MATNAVPVLLWVVVFFVYVVLLLPLIMVNKASCYQIFNFLKKIFVSQPIVIKLRIQMDDNILSNRTVSYFILS